MGVYEPACIRFALEAKIADVLADDPGGLPVADISERTGIEQGKLARILRCLATKNCFREGEYHSTLCLFIQHVIDL
jgi:DNA-binding IclR family transcriptional regulator